MSSNYFEKLRLQGLQLDNGIEKLINIWKLPQLLIGGFAERTPETNSHLEAVWNNIKSTQNDIEQTVKECEAQENEAVAVEQFLQEIREEYKNLKKQSDDVEAVLAKYGYRYNENDLDQTILNGN